MGAVIPQVVVIAGKVLDAGDLSSTPDPRWLSEQTDHPTRWGISLDSMVCALAVFPRCRKRQAIEYNKHSWPLSGSEDLSAADKCLAAGQLQPLCGHSQQKVTLKSTCLELSAPAAASHRPVNSYKGQMTTASSIDSALSC